MNEQKRTSYQIVMLTLGTSDQFAKRRQFERNGIKS